MMRIQGRLIKVMTILIVTTAIVLGAFTCGKKDAGEFKIGAILPLTGDAAVWGQNAKEGIDLAVGLHNKIADDYKITVFYEDSQALPDKGVSAFRKLISFDKVQVVIGDIASSVNLAMAPIAEKNKVVVLSPGATAPKLSGIGEFFFRNWNSDDFEAKIAAEYLTNKKNIETAAIFLVNNDYGKGLEEAFQLEFSKKGGTVGIVESYSQNETIFRSQLGKIKNVNSEVIYLIGYPAEIPLIIRQARELDVRIPIMGTAAFEDPNILKAVNETKTTVYFPLPLPADTSSNEVRLFINKFQIKYDKAPGIICDTGYDAVNMIIGAFRLSGDKSGDGIRKGLNSLDDFPGASGTMTFDNNGDVSKPMGIRTVERDKFIWAYKPKS